MVPNKKIKHYKRHCMILLNAYLAEKERRHNAERRGDYWHRVACVVLSCLMAITTAIAVCLVIL